MNQMHKVTGALFKACLLRNTWRIKEQQLKISRALSQLSSEKANSYNYVIVGAGSAGCENF